jgi:hypothetical protein
MAGTRVLLLACLLLFEGITAGQDHESSGDGPGLNKNVIYGTAGFYPESLYSNILINYERMLFRIPGSFFQSFWLRAGAGPWVAWGNKGSNYVSTLSVLMGRQGAHLEIGSGVVFTYNSYIDEFHPIVNDRHLAGFFGFRHQKPGGNFILRTGIGWPEGIYLSLGYCF